jgi:hypothetical protein
VAKLAQSQVTSALLNAGLSTNSADILTGIGGAESGWDDSVEGDINLENATYGPSYGVFQIRTVKADTGTGSVRDIDWLAQSFANQVQAAISISGGGVNFRPWTTYTDGAYLNFEPGAGGVTTGTGTGTGTSATNTGLLGGITGDVASEAEKIGYTLAFALLGLALVGFGIYKAVGPQIKSAAKSGTASVASAAEAL